MATQIASVYERRVGVPGHGPLIGRVIYDRDNQPWAEDLCWSLSKNVTVRHSGRNPCLCPRGQFHIRTSYKPDVVLRRLADDRRRRSRVRCPTCHGSGFVTPDATAKALHR